MQAVQFFYFVKNSKIATNLNAMTIGKFCTNSVAESLQFLNLCNPHFVNFVIFNSTRLKVSLKFCCLNYLSIKFVLVLNSWKSCKQLLKIWRNNNFKICINTLRSFVELVLKSFKTHFLTLVNHEFLSRDSILADFCWNILLFFRKTDFGIKHKRGKKLLQMRNKNFFERRFKGNNYTQFD